MNGLQLALLAVTLAILGAIGYIFYLVGGIVPAVLFVFVSLTVAYVVDAIFGDSSDGDSGGARQGRQSKGARTEE